MFLLDCMRSRIMFSCMIGGRDTPTVKGGGGELVVVRDLTVREKGSYQSFVGNFFFLFCSFI